MKLLISEVLQKVSNAKTKAKKIELLQQHNTDALRMLLIWNFDDSVISELPAGEVPYTANEAPVGTEHTVLEKEARLLYNFVQGGNNGLQQSRRENMFIQMLEGLHKDEANVLCLVKDKQLGKKYKITKACVSEAFPQINWGGRTA
tara:strand:+ start:796 stop:1233 length:438 start_codon:yes stop_codon:yes gene_type:complete